MAIYAKFKLGGTDIEGTAKNVEAAAGAGLTVPDLNGSTILQSVSFGSALAGSGAGGQSYDIGCTKEIDQGTPKNMEALDNNQVVEGTIYLSRMAEGAAGTNEEGYMTVELKDGRITSQQIAESGDGKGTETLAIKYDTLDVTYKGGIAYQLKWANRT